MGEAGDWAAMAESMLARMARRDGDDEGDHRRSPRLASSAERRRADREEAPAAAIATSRVNNMVQVNLFGRMMGAAMPRNAPSPAARPAPPAAPAAADDLPELSAHERKRQPKRKLPEGPRGRNKAGRTTKETKVNLAERVRDFGDHGIKVSAGVLFCAPCKEEMPNLKESIRRHINTSKHKLNFERTARSMAANKELFADIAEYFEENQHLHGASLSTKVHVYRCRVLESFLISGTPISRMDFFRPLLERDGLALTDRSHLASYVPHIEQAELNLIKKELAGNFLGIQFDGTSRLGEAINIVGRYCTADFNLSFRLLRFLTTKLHLKSAELARVVTRVLCTELGIPPEMLVCISRDSVSVNGAACRLLMQSTFTSAENQLCISHTLQNAGIRINFDVLNEFFTPWLELVGGTHPHRGAKALWASMVAPTKVPGYSNVRWYASAEIQFVLGENFHQLEPFLSRLDELQYGDATRAKLRNVFDSPAKQRTLKLQLAAILDMKPLVRTTYELEGERLELLLMYERIQTLQQVGESIKAGEAGVLRNLDAALRADIKLTEGVAIAKVFEGLGLCHGKITTSRMVDSTIYPGLRCRAYKVFWAVDKTTQELEEEEIRPLLVVEHMPERKRIISGLLPAFEYLEARMNGTCEASNYSCQHMYEVAKAARAFDPSFAAQYVVSAHVDTMVSTILPLMEHINAGTLKSELPAYLSAAKEFEVERDDVTEFSDKVLTFWKHTSKKNMPEWRKAARIIFSMSPNSASCERVFSLLANMYGDSQEHVIADHLQASLMLRFNKREVSSSSF